MPVKTLKLYRGVSAKEFRLATPDKLRKNKKVWKAIVERRASGDFSYPSDLDNRINQLHSDLRLERQFFTDCEDIAKAYVRKVGGLLVEIHVPLADVVRHFDVDFQNFARRKKQFEVVYCVKGSVLSRWSKSWRLKVKSLG